MSKAAPVLTAPTAVLAACSTPAGDVSDLDKSGTYCHIAVSGTYETQGSGNSRPCNWMRLGPGTMPSAVMASSRYTDTPSDTACPPARHSRA
jgi:hypothetical protein